MDPLCAEGTWEHNGMVFDSDKRGRLVFNPGSIA